MRLLRYFRKKYKIEKQFRGYWVFKREKLVKKFDSWAPFDTALGFAEYDRELTGIEVEEIYAHSFRNRLIKKDLYFKLLKLWKKNKITTK